MKNILLIIILVINFDSLKSQPLKLTIDESIDLAIENNENLKNSYLEEKISKALSKIVKKLVISLGKAVS